MEASKMDIDQRLDRLTERHEALTQSVELMGLQIATIMDALSKLVELAQSHERRIDRLETN
jgi:chromosome segregation ATPase